MTFFRHYALWLLFTALILAQDVVAAQQAKILPCPTADELRSELVIQQEKLLKLKSGLVDFMAGKAATDVPLSALFLIDLSDAAAVAKRAEYLRQGIPSTELYLDCTLSVAELRPAADKVLALQREVSALRLSFLSLPPEKRSALGCRNKPLYPNYISPAFWLSTLSKNAWRFLRTV